MLKQFIREGNDEAGKMRRAELIHTALILHQNLKNHHHICTDPQALAGNVVWRPLNDPAVFQDFLNNCVEPVLNTAPAPGL